MSAAVLLVQSAAERFFRVASPAEELSEGEIIIGSDEANPFEGIEAYREPDWDGENAQPVLEQTIENAMDVAALLSAGFAQPDVSPGTDGSVALLWEAPRLYLYVDVYPDGSIHYYYQLGAKQPVEEVIPPPFNLNTVRGRLQHVIEAPLMHAITTTGEAVIRLVDDVSTSVPSISFRSPLAAA